MSIRIHELAKKLSMDNKDLMALLKERGYPAKSVSSTVDNITAEALEQEVGANFRDIAEPGGTGRPAGERGDDRCVK